MPKDKAMQEYIAIVEENDPEFKVSLVLHRALQMLVFLIPDRPRDVVVYFVGVYR